MPRVRYRLPVNHRRTHAASISHLRSTGLTSWLTANQGCFTAVASTTLAVASLAVALQSARIADFQNELSVAQNEVLAAQRDLQAVQAAQSTSQTALMEQELRIMHGESQPIFEVEWCFRGEGTHGSDLEYLRVTNAGAPILNIEVTTYTFMELGRGTSRADSDMRVVAIPGYFWDTALLEGRFRSEGIVAELIGDTQTFYSQLDEWNDVHADIGDTFFYRPHHFLRIAYTDRNDIARSQFWEIPPMGGKPAMLNSREFSAVEDLYARALEQGAQVTSTPEDVWETVVAYERADGLAEPFYEEIYR